jgi:hypothetical protein
MVGVFHAPLAMAGGGRRRCNNVASVIAGGDVPLPVVENEVQILVDILLKLPVRAD